MANKLVTVEQLDAAVDGFAAEIKAQDFEKAANLKSLAYADAVSSTHMASSLTTILAGKLSNADAANLVAGEVGMTYRPGGSYEFANLPAPSAATYGMVYNVVDDFVTDTRFAEGEGKSYKSGSEVGVVMAEKADPADPDVYIYNVFSGFVDVSKFASQSSFTTFKAALDDLEVASSTDIQNLIDGLSLDDATPVGPNITWPEPGVYDATGKALKTWDELVAANVVYEIKMFEGESDEQTHVYIDCPGKDIYDLSDLNNPVVVGQMVGLATVAPTAAKVSVKAHPYTNGIGTTFGGLYGGLPITDVLLPEDIHNIAGPNGTNVEPFLKNNTAITEITIPDAVDTLDRDSFEGCTNLATIYYKGAMDDTDIKAKSNATVVRN